MDEIKSPCINVCKLEGNNICKGCYRSLDEIAGWGYASETIRRQIINSASLRKQSDRNASLRKQSEWDD